MTERAQKISLYWYCQFLGWGAALLYWSFYSFSNQLSWIPKLVQLFLPFIISIGTTHYYKIWAHRNGILKLSIGELLPKLFIALALLTLSYIISSFLIGSIAYGHWMTNALPGIISGGIRYMAIWLLAFHLYHYAKRESILEVEKSQLETLALQAQLDALAHELNPHFLFNALNSIKALVLEDPAQAKNAIVLLSNLLRHTLNHTSDSFSTVKEEVMASKDYLQMESLRFEERLQVKMNIPIALQSLKIPKLSLLSLVENAIKHGIATKPEGGLLEIDLQRDKDQLYLSILNPGKLNIKGQLGTGNANLRSRLRLLYKEKASLRLQQISEDSIETKLQIPIEA